jgi:hypothetical protein
MSRCLQMVEAAGADLARWRDAAWHEARHGTAGAAAEGRGLRLACDVEPRVLETIVREIRLSGAIDAAQQIMAGGARSLRRSTVCLTPPRPYAPLCGARGGCGRSLAGRLG